MNRNIVLATDRMRLEPLAASHLAAIAKIGNDPALWEFTFQNNPFAANDGAEEWLREALESDHVPFAIVDVASGQAIGSTRYLDIHPEHRKLEIGWTFIAREYWRTHVNAHCKYLLLRYAFEEWDAVRVQLKGEAINVRSRNAMLGIGATFEGTMRSFRIVPRSGELRDVAFYSVIASEWPAVKARLTDRILGSRAAG